MEDMGDIERQGARQKPCSSGDTSRQRLRPWLEAKIDSNTIPGLYWIDRQKKIFRVLWKRGGKQDWSPQDSKIFEEWAKYTGRYREGIDSPDYATWKTRLRCAFNKAPDIEEIKDKTNLGCNEPYRVYRLKDRKDCSPPTHHTPKAARFSYADQSSPEMPSEQTDCPMAMNTEVPTVVDKLNSTSSGSLGSDLKQIPSDELYFKGSDETFGNPVDQADLLATIGEQMDYSNSEMATEPMPTPVASNMAGSIPLLDENIRSEEMYLQIHYLKLPINEVHVTNTKGCRLFYRSAQIPFKVNDPEMQEKLYGPEDLEEICFPFDVNLFDRNNAKQADCTVKLLQCTDRGLQLESNEDGIFAIRRCRCVVFYASPVTGGESHKLNRGERIQLFNMNQFLESVKRYLQGEAPKPLINVQLGFGQKWPYNCDKSDVFISVNLFNRLAYEMLKKAEQIKMHVPSHSLKSDVHLSNETSLDQLAKRLRDMVIQQQGC